MLGRWLRNRIQNVEHALASGHIDEAYRLATEPGMLREPSAARVLDQLARALLARARLHVQGGRNIEALGDVDRIAAVCRITDEAAELRDRVLTILTGAARAGPERNAGADPLEITRVGPEASPTGGVNDEPPGAGAGERVRDTSAADALVDEARARLRDGDALGAGRVLASAAYLGPSAGDCVRQTVDACRRALRDWLDQGRLDRFTDAARRLRDLTRLDSSLDEFRSMAHLIQSAAARLGRGDYAGARGELLRLSGVARQTAWLGDALSALDQIIAARDRLLASPLGLVEAALQKSLAIGTAPPGVPGDNPGMLGETVSPPVAREVDPLLLLVDGTGSIMLTNRDTVRVGRAGAGGAVDIPIPADLHSHHAEITRNGEDYFLIALGPVQVNGRPVRRALLRDGDRLVMGRSAKMVFCKPGDRCESAVLVLGDRCRLSQDVERVVLFKDTCLVGPDPGCHVRTREGDCRLVLFRRGARVMVRRRPLHDRGASREAEELPLGQTREMGDLRLTLKAYRDTGSVT